MSEPKIVQFELKWVKGKLIRIPKAENYERYSGYEVSNSGGGK